MPERNPKRVHSGYSVLDIGGDVGALVIYTKQELLGRQIEVSPKGNTGKRIHTDVLERRFNGRVVFAALFLELLAGDYYIWGNDWKPVGDVTVSGGEVAELDWSSIIFDAPPAVDHPRLASDILPPRYRNGRAVSAAPMGSAPIRYTDDGQAAWSEMWTDFCELALAGGPPHRDSLLEPVAPDEVKVALDAYERVVAEVERGLRLVTGLPTVRSEGLGWVGLVCQDEEMALWLLRAIVVDNICVRREGSVLFLPAGPSFQLEKEIKNVVTAVAKTYHYWTEHAAPVR